MSAGIPEETESHAALGDCEYLPKGVLSHRFGVLKTRVAYRIWRRKLRRCGGLKKDARFRLLDVGCGPGYLLRCMETWFPRAETYGLDAEQRLLDYAGRHLKRTQLVQGRAEQPPFGAEFFDVVAALHVLEHLDNPDSFLAEAHRVLRPGGFLLAATPNPCGVAAAVLKDKWSGYRDDHVSLKLPRQWREMITHSGFEILSDGTTGLSGFAVFRRTPLALINWLPIAAFGYFPWERGESYMTIARKH